MIFLEMTERIQAERRREALLKLNDRFRNLFKPDHLADTAYAAFGAALDVGLNGRVATRYDKLLADFMGSVKLAAIAIWLK